MNYLRLSTSRPLCDLICVVILTVGRTERIELSPPPPQLSSPQLFSSSFISLVRIHHPLCLPFVTCIYSNHPPLPPTESFPLALRSPPHRPISFVDSFGRRLPLRDPICPSFTLPPHTLSESYRTFFPLGFRARPD